MLDNHYYIYLIVLLTAFSCSPKSNNSDTENNNLSNKEYSLMELSEENTDNASDITNSKNKNLIFIDSYQHFQLNSKDSGDISNNNLLPALCFTPISFVGNQINWEEIVPSRYKLMSEINPLGIDSNAIDCDNYGIAKYDYIVKKTTLYKDPFHYYAINKKSLFPLSIDSLKGIIEYDCNAYKYIKKHKKTTNTSNPGTYKYEGEFVATFHESHDLEDKNFVIASKKLICENCYSISPVEDIRFKDSIFYVQCKNFKKPIIGNFNHINTFNKSHVHDKNDIAYPQDSFLLTLNNELYLFINWDDLESGCFGYTIYNINNLHISNIYTSFIYCDIQ